MQTFLPQPTPRRPPSARLFRLARTRWPERYERMGRWMRANIGGCMAMSQPRLVEALLKAGGFTPDERAEALAAIDAPEPVEVAGVVVAAEDYERLRWQGSLRAIPPCAASAACPRRTPWTTGCAPWRRAS